MALVLTVGGGAITLVQKSLGTRATTTTPTDTLPAPSGAGTTLIAVLSNPNGLPTTTPSVDRTLGVGWFQFLAATPHAMANVEVWVYERNVGGITSATFASVNAAWSMQLSEWSTGHTDSSRNGTAASSSGTTLALTTTGNILVAGSLVIAAWEQVIAAPATATFTTPTGYSSLIQVITS